MRRTACLLLAASAVLALRPAPLVAQGPARRFAVAPDASVRIVNLVGSVRVIGWDRDSLVVTGAPPEGGGTLLAGGGRAAVKVVVDAGPLPAVGTALEIHAPRMARLWIKSATAPIAVEGMRGEIDVATVSGQISIRGAPSLLTAESMDGDLLIEAPARVTRLKTAGGAIVVTGAAGDVTATSVSGPIRLRGSVITGRLESVSGEIVCNAGVAAGGRLDLQTHEAPITLLLPPGAGVTVEASTYGGRTESMIPGAAGKPTRAKAVQYVIGSGRAWAVLRSLKGDLTLRQALPRPNPSP
ncbi:MAG TPA: hypothetical protein VFU00_07840 [Gemmatimonadales bacterium]|nr:hypothetical protein [Gemmatimonadales bacterium]